MKWKIFLITISISIIIIGGIVAMIKPELITNLLSPSEKEPVINNVFGDINDLGYEYLDSNTILHLWNKNDNYYINLSSGIQISNYYEEYWTHNIWCAGYKTTEWNYLCGDNLPIVLNVTSDNLTYIKVEGNRNVTISGRTVNFGLTYYLDSNDDEINITPRMKLLSGANITNDLGFAWKTNDIKIRNDYEFDEIIINNSIYKLNENLDLLYNNLEDNQYILRDGMFYSFIKLRWENNTNSFVQIKSEAGQINAPVTLAIVTTGLNLGQTKQTTFYWVDPFQSEYTGFSFDTAGSGNIAPYGITQNGTYFWITDDTDDEVYQYWMNGTYSSFSFDTAGSGNGAPYGITQNGTYFWITDDTDDEVYQYWMNGTYSSFSFDTAGSGNGAPYGITQNGTYFWTTDTGNSEVYQYWMNGTYSSFSFDTAGSGNIAPYGITQNGTYFWTTDNTLDEVYQYWMNGTYSSFSFDTAGSGNGAPYGITQNGTYFWITDPGVDEVYQYYGTDYPKRFIQTYTVNASQADLKGIAGNGTHFFICDPVDDVIYIYNLTFGVAVGSFAISGMNDCKGVTANSTFLFYTDQLDDVVYYSNFTGGQTGSFANAVADKDSYGLTTNNTFIWQTDLADDEVYRYWRNGTYINSFDTAASGLSDPYGIANNGTHFFISDITDDVTYVFLMNGTFTGYYFNNGGVGNDNPAGIWNNGTYFWITDDTDDKVYLYYEAQPSTTDTTAPTYSNIQVNNTSPAILDYVLFSALWADTSLANYTFSWNATGASCDTWANDSTVIFTGASNWSNATKQIPATCLLANVPGIAWRVYANDSSGNQNATPITFSFSSASANCWQTSAGKIMIPPTCQYAINTNKGYS
jgi:hypothetical protein